MIKELGRRNNIYSELKHNDEIRREKVDEKKE